MLRNFKVILVVLVVLVLAGGAYAFAAANTVLTAPLVIRPMKFHGYTVTRYRVRPEYS